MKDTMYDEFKFELTLNLDMYYKVKILSDKTDQDIAVIIAKGILLYEECLKAKDNGKFVGIADTKENLSLEFTGL
jgi:hypothetical protein